MPGQHGMLNSVSILPNYWHRDLTSGFPRTGSTLLHMLPHTTMRRPSLIQGHSFGYPMVYHVHNPPGGGETMMTAEVVGVGVVALEGIVGTRAVDLPSHSEEEAVGVVVVVHPTEQLDDLGLALDPLWGTSVHSPSMHSPLIPLFNPWLPPCFSHKCPWLSPTQPALHHLSLVTHWKTHLSLCICFFSSLSFSFLHVTLLPDTRACSSPAQHHG